MLGPGDDPFESVDDEWERHQELRRGRVVRGGASFGGARGSSAGPHSSGPRSSRDAGGGGRGPGGLGPGGLGLRGMRPARQGGVKMKARSSSHSGGIGGGGGGGGGGSGGRNRAPAFDRPVPGSTVALAPRCTRPSAPALVVRNSTLLVGMPRPSTAASFGSLGCGGAAQRRSRLRTPLRPVTAWSPPPSRGATRASGGGGSSSSSYPGGSMFGGRNQRAQIWVSPERGVGAADAAGFQLTGHATGWETDVAPGAARVLPPHLAAGARVAPAAATDVHWRGGTGGWQRVAPPRLLEEKRMVATLGSAWVDNQMASLLAQASAVAESARSDAQAEAAAAQDPQQRSPVSSPPRQSLFAPHGRVN